MQEPEIVKHLRKSLYVDDFISGAETDESALQIYKGAKQLNDQGRIQPAKVELQF